ncbi:MAG: cytochrome c-type biogenesis protein CcmH [Candidatus Acidiferrales bacterium]
MTEMLKRGKFAALACSFVLAMACVQPAHAQSERAKALGTKVMCMCGGCSDAAGKCTHMGGAFAGPCETAQKELKEVDARISSGSSDDLILQSFVQEYGPTVLISPPARGFDLWAWLMPIVMLLAGAILVSFVVLQWRRRTVVAPAPRISPELIARARHQMAAHIDAESDD